jgi:ABC-type nitrate/sulfonate/bicarbonate transport system ATPase subunit
MPATKIVQLPIQRGRDSEARPSEPVKRRHSVELVIRDLNKSFTIDGKSLPVLRDINLVARPGQFITIVGASGCGKSTLLRLIAGLDRGFDGEILFGGRPVSGPSLDRGLVFQDHRLFPWLTIEQNIASAFSSRPIDTATKRLLVKDHIALVGLKGFENAYPHQVSGGMAQRAAIARALVNEPDILLLDEPLGAVDALTRLYLQDELRRIWLEKGVTMIMVTHDIEEAVFLGDQVIVLQPRPGRISKVVDVGLPQPRDREDSRLLKLKKEILGEFHNAAPINYSI